METARANARRASAPYGRACVACVKAKGRCVGRVEREGEGEGCERCQRLGKVCVSSLSVRGRRGGGTRKSRVEGRLDDIVSLLRGQGVAATRGLGDGDASESPRTEAGVSPDDSAYDAGDARLTDAELRVFREQYLPYFPLMCVSPHVSAAAFEQEKPVLALAVKTLTTRTATRQGMLARKLRTVLAQKILVEGERSLQLLLGLLVAIAWSLSFTHSKQYLGAMVGLARPLVVDLKFDRGAGCPGSNPPLAGEGEETAQTNAGRRAFVACFALSAIISTTMKFDAMRWSAQLDSACRVLSAQSEVEGDQILAALARLSRVALEAEDVYRRAMDEPDMAIDPAFSIASLECSLDQAKAMLTAEQLQHSTVTVFLHATSASIYELALLHPTPLPAPSCNHNTRRIEHFTRLLCTCKANTSLFLAFPLVHITAPLMLVFGYVIKLGHALLTLQSPGWDTALACTELDLARIFEQATAQCERANAVVKEETGEDSVFRLAADLMRGTAPRWRVPLALEAVDSGARFGEALDLEAVDEFWLGGVLDF